MKSLTFSTMTRLAAASPLSTFQTLSMPVNGPKVPAVHGLPTCQGPPMPTLYPKTSAINGLPMPTLYPLSNGSKIPEAMEDFNHDALVSAYPSMANFPDYVPMANGSVVSPTHAAQWDWDLSDFVPVYNGSVVSLPTPTIPFPINIDAVPTAFVTAFPRYNVTGDKQVHIDPPNIVSYPEKNEYIVQVRGHVDETLELIEDFQNNLPFLLPPVTKTNSAASCPPGPQATKYCHPEHCHNGHCHEKHCHQKQEIDDLQTVDPNWVWSDTSTDGPNDVDVNPCSQALQRAHREQVGDAMARLHPNATQPSINRRHLLPGSNRQNTKHQSGSNLSHMPSATSRTAHRLPAEE